jgi:putative phosphoribosyl transferase
MRFHDRVQAGRLLAKALERYKDHPDVLVLALPRGGVPVAYEVAKALTAPLDVFIVRKLGVPGHEELAMGAIASGGIRALNTSVIRQLNIPQSAIDAVAAREEAEVRRREELYRGGKSPLKIENRTIILVDCRRRTSATTSRKNHCRRAYRSQ